jgi:hypothetical protein
VNIDQLMESLSDSAPDPDHVLASFHRKRHAARSRMYAASGGLGAAVVAVVIGVVLSSVAGSRPTMSSSAAAGAMNAPAATGAPAAPYNGMAAGAASGSGSAESAAAACGAGWLQAQMAQAVRRGGSVIIGYGTQTSGVAPVQVNAALTYYSVTLRSVQTLAGPAVSSGRTAWVAGTGSSDSAGSGGASSASASAAPLARALPPDGEFFGIVSPPATSGAPGPVLQAAPVTKGNVQLRGPGCWDITASGSGSLHEFAQAAAPSAAGSTGKAAIIDVPLATAEYLATKAG